MKIIIKIESTGAGLILGLCWMMCFFLSFGCPHRVTSKDHGATAPDIAPHVINENQSLLFTFFDDRAEMRTVERLQDVPQDALADVMITDPSQRLSPNMILVADLRHKGKEGTYRTRQESKGTWLDRVMPKTSRLTEREQVLAQAAPSPRSPVTSAIPQAERPRSQGKAKKKRRAQATPSAVKPQPAQFVVPKAPPSAIAQPTQGPKVILFSTSWCPSCKTARQYFQSRRIPFVELDVERDPQALAQYQSIQRAQGLQEGVVPVIVINGRALQGFAQGRIEALLRTP